MSYDMHVAAVRKGVFLKVEHLALVARLLNLTSDAALSRAIGMDRNTIAKARKGIVGERFIATVLSVFGQHADELAKLGVGVRFEDFFEIREKAVAQ